MGKFKNFTKKMQEIIDRKPTEEQIAELSKVLKESGLSEIESFGELKTSKSNIIKLQTITYCSAVLMDACISVSNSNVSDLSNNIVDMEKAMKSYEMALFYMKLDKEK